MNLKSQAITISTKNSTYMKHIKSEKPACFTYWCHRSKVNQNFIGDRITITYDQMPFVDGTIRYAMIMSVEELYNSKYGGEMLAINASCLEDFIIELRETLETKEPIYYDYQIGFYHIETIKHQSNHGLPVRMS